MTEQNRGVPQELIEVEPGGMATESIGFDYFSISELSVTHAVEVVDPTTGEPLPVEGLEFLGGSLDGLTIEITHGRTQDSNIYNSSSISIENTLGTKVYVALKRVTPRTQLIDFENPELEFSLDKITRILQEADTASGGGGGGAASLEGLTLEIRDSEALTGDAISSHITDGPRRTAVALVIGGVELGRVDFAEDLLGDFPWLVGGVNLVQIEGASIIRSDESSYTAATHIEVVAINPDFTRYLAIADLGIQGGGGGTDTNNYKGVYSAATEYVQGDTVYHRTSGITGGAVFWRALDTVTGVTPSLSKEAETSWVAVDTPVGHRGTLAPGDGEVFFRAGDRVFLANESAELLCKEEGIYGSDHVAGNEDGPGTGWVRVLGTSSVHSFARISGPGPSLDHISTDLLDASINTLLEQIPGNEVLSGQNRAFLTDLLLRVAEGRDGLVSVPGGWRWSAEQLNAAAQVRLLPEGATEGQVALWRSGAWSAGDVSSDSVIFGHGNPNDPQTRTVTIPGGYVLDRGILHENAFDNVLGAIGTQANAFASFHNTITLIKPMAIALSTDADKNAFNVIFTSTDKLYVGETQLPNGHTPDREHAPSHVIIAADGEQRTFVRASGNGVTSKIYNEDFSSSTSATGFITIYDLESGKRLEHGARITAMGFNFDGDFDNFDNLRFVPNAATTSEVVYYVEGSEGNFFIDVDTRTRKVEDIWVYHGGRWISRVSTSPEEILQAAISRGVLAGYFNPNGEESDLIVLGEWNGGLGAIGGSGLTSAEGSPIYHAGNYIDLLEKPSDAHHNVGMLFYPNGIFVIFPQGRADEVDTIVAPPTISITLFDDTVIELTSEITASTREVSFGEGEYSSIGVFYYRAGEETWDKRDFNKGIKSIIGDGTGWAITQRSPSPDVPAIARQAATIYVRINPVDDTPAALSYYEDGSWHETRLGGGGGGGLTWSSGRFNPNVGSNPDAASLVERFSAFRGYGVIFSSGAATLTQTDPSGAPILNTEAEASDSSTGFTATFNGESITAALRFDDPSSTVLSHITVYQTGSSLLADMPRTITIRRGDVEHTLRSPSVTLSPGTINGEEAYGFVYAFIHSVLFTFFEAGNYINITSADAPIQIGAGEGVVPPNIDSDLYIQESFHGTLLTIWKYLSVGGRWIRSWDGSGSAPPGPTEPTEELSQQLSGNIPPTIAGGGESLGTLAGDDLALVMVSNLSSVLQTGSIAGDDYTDGLKNLTVKYIEGSQSNDRLAAVVLRQDELDYYALGTHGTGEYQPIIKAIVDGELAEYTEKTLTVSTVSLNINGTDFATTSKKTYTRLYGPIITATSKVSRIYGEGNSATNRLELTSTDTSSAFITVVGSTWSEREPLARRVVAGNWSLTDDGWELLTDAVNRLNPVERSLGVQPGKFDVEISDFPNDINIVGRSENYKVDIEGNVYLAADLSKSPTTIGKFDPGETFRDNLSRLNYVSLIEEVIGTETFLCAAVYDKLLGGSRNARLVFARVDSAGALTNKNASTNITFTVTRQEAELGVRGVIGVKGYTQGGSFRVAVTVLRGDVDDDPSIHFVSGEVTVTNNVAAWETHTDNEYDTGLKPVEGHHWVGVSGHVDFVSSAWVFTTLEEVAGKYVINSYPREYTSSHSLQLSSTAPTRLADAQTARRGEGHDLWVDTGASGITAFAIVARRGVTVWGLRNIPNRLITLEKPQLYTQAEYDALSDARKMDGTVRYTPV